MSVGLPTEMPHVSLITNRSSARIGCRDTRSTRELSMRTDYELASIGTTTSKRSTRWRDDSGDETGYVQNEIQDQSFIKRAVEKRSIASAVKVPDEEEQFRSRIDEQIERDRSNGSGPVALADSPLTRQPCRHWESRQAPEKILPITYDARGRHCRRDPWAFTNTWGETRIRTLRS